MNSTESTITAWVKVNFTDISPLLDAVNGVPENRNSSVSSCLFPQAVRFDERCLTRSPLSTIQSSDTSFKRTE
jgi:hypothetical protein